MIEKFSDYEGQEFLNKEGTFVFEITACEIKASASGNVMAVFDAKSEAGKTTMYHSLNPKARWSYNNLIKACLNLTTKEQIYKFECDYETIGQSLIGKKFKGTVECQEYEKDIKVLADDGTYIDDKETKQSYKIISYEPA